MGLSTTFKDATSGINHNVTSGHDPWETPGNAISTNQAYAVIADGEELTDYLITSGYDFSEIPPYAEILGVEVQVIRTTQDSDATSDAELFLAVGTTLMGDNQATYMNWPETVDTTVVYGGPTDLMGWLDITAADVKNSNFGFAFKVDDTSKDNVMKVDSILIKIHYESAITLLSLSPF